MSASVEQAGEIRSPELKVDSCEPTEAGAENQTQLSKQQVSSLLGHLPGPIYFYVYRIFAYMWRPRFRQIPTLDLQMLVNSAVNLTQVL